MRCVMKQVSQVIYVECDWLGFEAISHWPMGKAKERVITCNAG